MTPQEAIIANVTGKLASYELYRALLAHVGWRVPRPPGEATLPTILVTDAALTPSIWAFSSEDAYQAACREHHAEAIGPVATTDWLDELLVDDDPRVTRFVVDPASPIVLVLGKDELAALRQLARATRVERAMRTGDHAAIRAYPRYAVPYFGELGRGHNIITLPSERGAMVAAFTAADAIDAFLATGSDANRSDVKFAIVDGAGLFGSVGAIAAGVLVNPAGPATFGFELSVCNAIAAAAPSG